MNMATAAHRDTHAVTIPQHRQPAVQETSIRIDGLVAQSRPLAQWWVELVEELDELRARLVQEGNESWLSLYDQISQDAPHLTPKLRMIDDSQERLERELFEVRMLAGEAAGDSAAIRDVSARVAGLLSEIRRHEERINQALYDAYERDLGGESA